MRRCLVLAVGLFSGCITATEVDDQGLSTTRTYFLFVPLKKHDTQTRPLPSQSGAKSPQRKATP